MNSLRLLENIPQSCSNCALQRGCWGGAPIQADLFGCGIKCFGCNDACQDVCPAKPDLLDRIREVRGLDGRVPHITPSSLGVHQYIPMIDRRITGLDLLDEPVVAVPTRVLVQGRGRKYGAIACDADELRRRLGISPAAEIIAVSVAHDDVIERFWKLRRRHNIPAHLARLGLAGVTCPNYSFFLDATRLNTVINRHRMICVMEDLTEAGVPVIPHLNGLCDSDWTYWAQFLSTNEGVTTVAKEFQTGAGEVANRPEVLRRLGDLQQKVGRPIHLIAVAGGKLVGELRRVVARVSVVDSTPFMKTLNRQKKMTRGGWTSCPTRGVQGMFDLLRHNIDLHREWILRPQPLRA